MIKSNNHILAFFLIVILVGCNDRRFCEGSIVVENEIPDTTLYVGGEPFHRDIYESPPVFKHTANKDIAITVGSNSGHIVSAKSVLNKETNRPTVIEVTANNPGTTLVTVTATDGCTFNETETSFQVTVRDTTN